MGTLPFLQITHAIFEQIHVDETKGTLFFASRANRVTNCAQVNEVRRILCSWGHFLVHGWMHLRAYHFLSGFTPLYSSWLIHLFMLYFRL